MVRCGCGQGSLVSLGVFAKDGTPMKEAKVSGYAAYMKENYRLVAAEADLPVGTPKKEVFKLVSKLVAAKYNEDKASSLQLQF